jgi:hypothetical protein
MNRCYKNIKSVSNCNGYGNNKNNYHNNDFIYKYETFDSIYDIESNSVYSSCSEEDSDHTYGYFIDLENMEPVETVEYYVVKNIFNNEYNVCKRTIRNLNNIKIVNEGNKQSKRSRRNIFRYLGKYIYENIHIILMGIFATTIIVCGSEDNKH